MIPLLCPLYSHINPMIFHVLFSRYSLFFTYSPEILTIFHAKYIYIPLGYPFYSLKYFCLIPPWYPLKSHICFPSVFSSTNVSATSQPILAASQMFQQHHMADIDSITNVSSTSQPILAVTLSISNTRFLRLLRKMEIKTSDCPETDTKSADNYANGLMMSNNV